MKNNSDKKLLRNIKILHTIACTLAGISFFFFIGTAGALECDTIGLCGAIIQCAICVAATLLFIKCAEYLNAYMNAIKYRIHHKNEQRVRIANNKS